MSLEFADDDLRNAIASEPPSQGFLNLGLVFDLFLGRETLDLAIAIIWYSPGSSGITDTRSAHDRGSTSTLQSTKVSQEEFEKGKLKKILFL